MSIRNHRYWLTRFFSVTSLVGIAVVTAALIFTYRELTDHHLVEHESRANADLTRAFANVVWTSYRDFVHGSSGRSREDLVGDPTIARLRADVLEKMGGLRIVKVKIYNAEGLTVFSTDEKQIGELKRDNAGFQRARAGRVVSLITHRDRFDAFEGTVNNRSLISSYIPVASTPGGPVESVFEVYSDVTDLLAQQHRAQWQVAAVVVCALGVLYLFLFFVVRRADRTIQRQHEAQKLKEAEVRHMAYHDALTGLPNRAYFTERLEECITLAQRDGHSCALMFVDLDRFKFVNDSLGHDAGDALLQSVATRLKACLRTRDLVFRMGGDEFTVILPQTSGPEDTSAVARRVLEALAPPIKVREHELAIGASLGIAVYPGDGETAEDLLRNADAAMYAVKQSGRDSYAFYRSEMNRQALQRLEFEVALKNGFRNGEFTLYYQPRMDAATHCIVALEASLRWIRPSRGVVPPAEFVGTLEDCGMTTIVGEWVLRTACGQIRQWRESGMSPPRVAINVSPAQFASPNFLEVIVRVLADTGVAPSMIEIELTESVLAGLEGSSRSKLAELKALGVGVSLDNFGTGYSSLSYLRHVEVDTLKIDRSLICDITENARDRAVASAILTLAKALRITVVAEGVETDAQASLLASIGCNELQGSLFHRPIPADRVRTILGDGARVLPDLPEPRVALEHRVPVPG